jgi:hypothetical protein
MISDFVSGKANLQKMLCREDDFWKKNQVQALTGKKALNLNLTDHTVRLDSGEKVAYQKLLIATPQQDGDSNLGSAWNRKLASARSSGIPPSAPAARRKASRFAPYF